MDTTSAGAGRTTDRLFFCTMALLATLIVFWGFSPTFYQRHAELPSLSTLLMVHGTAFTAWILLFITQVSLVAANRRDLHKRLGIVGAVLAACMVVLGTLTAIDAMRRGNAPVPQLDPRSFFVIPMRDIALFTVLVGSGLYWRRDPAMHKRLMLLSTLAMLDAAFARIPLPWIAAGGPPVFFGLVDLLVLAGFVYDWRTRGRVHPAFVWGGLLVILTQPLALAISGTAPWLAFADWCLGR